VAVGVAVRLGDAVDDAVTVGVAVGGVPVAVAVGVTPSISIWLMSSVLDSDTRPNPANTSNAQQKKTTTTIKRARGSDDILILLSRNYDALTSVKL